MYSAEPSWPSDLGSNHVTHFWSINLWGNCMFFQTDVQHGGHAPWRVHNPDPATFALLSEAKFPADCTRTCGYEIPRHESYANGFFAHGFVNVREWKDR